MKKEEFITKINELGLGKYVFVKPNNYVRRPFSFGCFFDSNQWIAYETNERGMPEDIIRTISENEAFNRHVDIKFELYEALIYEKFPVAGAITVCGYTAESLKKSTHLSIFECYNFLIDILEKNKKRN